MLYLAQDLNKDLAKDLAKDNFDDIINKIYEYPSQIVRDVDNRKTFKVTINQKDYFIKHHNFQPYSKTIKEVLKNYLNLKKPVLSAINEVKAIHKLEEIGVDTMKVSGYGLNQKNLLKNNSFIITESLEPAESLENLDLILSQCSKKDKFNLKRKIIKNVAEITRKLHDNYLIHQDYYLCHFLFKDGNLYLIDLHRMQKVNKYLFKSKKLKELADLYYSSMTVKAVTKFDIFYFLKCYYNENSIRAIFKDSFKKTDREKIEARSQRLYYKAVRKNIIR